MPPRFYLEKFSTNTGKIIITDPEIIHQISHVLRLKSGEKFALFNSTQAAELSVIKHFNKGISANIISNREPDREPKKQLIIYPALLKNDRFEWVLQKGTELGIAGFMPIITSRTVISTLSDHKIRRYRKIIQEAAEQCGGKKLPDFAPAIPFRQAVDNIRDISGLKIIAWEGENETGLLQTIMPNEKKVHLFIGPEGGFTPEEIDLATSHSIKTVSLGSRILRAETASIAAGALILLS